MVMFRCGYEVIGVTPRVAKSVSCPECGERFKDAPALARHTGESHPVTAPQLWIEGAPALGEVLLQRPIRQEDAAFIGCAAIFVAKDGRSFEPWSSEQILAALKGDEPVILDLRLSSHEGRTNSALAVDLRLTIERPKDDELVAVDDSFVRIFTEAEGPDESSLDQFADVASQSGSAATYASALHEYVASILIKDRAPGTGSAIPFERHIAKQTRALAILGQFPGRALARAASSFVRFSLNDFVEERGPSGVPQLDDCVEALRHEAGVPNELARRSDDAAGGGCPADEATSYILLNWDKPASAAELAKMATRENITAADASKARALARRILGAESSEGHRLDQLLAGDPIFGR